MSQWVRGYNPTSGATIDNDALRDELDRAASAHNYNDQIYSGKRDLVFASGYKVSYASADNAYGKFVTVVNGADAGNNQTVGSGGVGLTVGAVTDITLDATGDAFAGSELANAVRLGVTLRVGSGGTRTIHHPQRAGYATANAFFMLEDGDGVADGHHIYSIADDVDRSVGASDALYAEVILQVDNTTRKISYWAGANAVGTPTTELRLNIRTIGYYV